MTKRIIDPVLNIFIGTSPSVNVARHLNREVSRLPDTDRRRVATLLIDTMRLQNNGQNGQMYGADVMQIQTPRFERHAAWTALQRENMYIKSANTNSEHKPGIAVAGAGGIRNNGHVALCSLATSVEQRIKDKLNQVIKPPPDVQNEQAPNSLRVNIIAFLGGGTGSGILPALSVISRTVANEKVGQPHTAIYAVLPEQPRGLTEEMRRRQRSNALASLMELTAILQLKDHQVSDSFVLGNLSVDVSALQAVDLVYLYGHGLLTEHQEIYQLIAMDLFLRIQDGHGSGFERKRQLPDLSALKNVDNRNLPTCFATSGVAEVIFPRAELIAAWSRAAARSMISAQASQVNDRSADNRFADELNTYIIGLIDSRIEALVETVRPAEFDSDVLDDGEAWWDKLEQRCADFQRKLSHEFTTLVSGIETQTRERVVQQMQKARTAIYDRAAHIYGTIAARLGVERDHTSVPTVEERDQTFEEKVFNRGFWDRFRRLDGQFIDYANEQLRGYASVIQVRYRRDVIQELQQRFSQELEVQRLMLDGTRTASTRLGDIDRTLLEDGKLPYTHPYNRMALPDRGLIEQCYLKMLRELGLGDEIHGLDVNRVFEEIDRDRKRQEEERQRNINAGLAGNDGPLASRGYTPKFEEFFAQRFREYFNPKNRPRPVVEIIREVGGEELLRTHFRWGLEWARSHLEYNAFQEPQTYGRVVRQLDVAVSLDQRDDLRTQIQQIIDQESSRSEIQNNLKLLDSFDPDRLAFLYTEYGIPVRAINGLHESDQSSYLIDYLESQSQWASGGSSIPPHSSTLLEKWVATPIGGGAPIVWRIADDQQRVKLAELYPWLNQVVPQP